jgi:UDP-N-acetylbacillosamine N-acetyltransferase
VSQEKYKNISIIGAGGHTRALLPIIRKTFKYSELLICDKTSCDQNESLLGVQVVSDERIVDSKYLIISIGENARREYFFKEFNEKIIKKNLFGKNVLIDDVVDMGVSNQIMSNVFINSCVRIGDNNIINTGSILEHEVTIGNNNHIAIGAKLCGRVTIGNKCMIGAGANIIDNLNITDDVIIGAGATVIYDIEKSGTYVGIPAIKVK